MDTTAFWTLYGTSAKTALGFFWKSGWAFVFGYCISAMIQAFVPKAKLTASMGKPDLKSVSLATVFGAASSSCSFAALAAARALLQKGAHFIATVAFMFASTNLVIELGVLIFIFLGWQYLLAEIVGGIVLIAISSVLIWVSYPAKWVSDARSLVDQEGGQQDAFDWRRRIASAEGWQIVGKKFGDDWAMVWEEILIGFTVAGFVAVLVPASFWAAIFLADVQADLPAWVVALENAAVAPFVAAATFIGSMGNIPLATVLNANGVMFAGIMGFIYSDLMVPPLVRVNAGYYGWKIALYIAGVMYLSIVATALLLTGAFSLLGLVPEGGREVSQVARFKVDYTLWLNLVSLAIVMVMAALRRGYRQRQDHGAMDHDHGGGLPVKRVVAWLCIAILAGGVLAFGYARLL